MFVFFIDYDLMSPDQEKTILRHLHLLLHLQFLNGTSFICANVIYPFIVQSIGQKLISDSNFRFPEMEVMHHGLPTTEWNWWSIWY